MEWNDQNFKKNKKTGMERYGIENKCKFICKLCQNNNVNYSKIMLNNRIIPFRY
jgi:hypothetical protein